MLTEAICFVVGVLLTLILTGRSKEAADAAYCEGWVAGYEHHKREAPDA